MKSKSLLNYEVIFGINQFMIMGFPMSVFEFFEVHIIILFYVSILFAAAVNKEGQIQPIQTSVFF